MLFSFRNYINRQKAKSMILKAVDGFYTLVGVIILVIFLIIAAPFVALMEWLSGDR